MTELLPRVRALALLARRYDIGLNIDAEEADRLELSLDLLEALCFDPELAGWNGIGFVVQAYQKRCPFVIDYLDRSRAPQPPSADGPAGQGRLLGQRDQARAGRRARRLSGLHAQGLHRRFLSRLRAQAAGGAGRGVSAVRHPQRADARRRSITWPGQNFYPGQYEFQCLHGMGEPLYEEVVGRDKLDRPCRIYAPVGTHETLLAYLVRRLLENGANTSFVNRIADEQSPSTNCCRRSGRRSLARSAARRAAREDPAAAPAVRRRARNSLGSTCRNEQRLASLRRRCSRARTMPWRAAPMLADDERRLTLARRRRGARSAQSGRSSRRRRHCRRSDARAGRWLRLAHAAAAAPIWQATPSQARADCLLAPPTCSKRRCIR